MCLPYRLACLPPGCGRRPRSTYSRLRTGKSTPTVVVGAVVLGSTVVVGGTVVVGAVVLGSTVVVGGTVVVGVVVVGSTVVVGAVTDGSVVVTPSVDRAPVVVVPPTVAAVPAGPGP